MLKRSLEEFLWLAVISIQGQSGRSSFLTGSPNRDAAGAVMLSSLL
jgi:hypothetical protein